MRNAQPSTGLVFPARHGKPYAPGSYRKPLATAASAAGITRPVNPYLLRHSFATIAWSIGIDMDTARRILRHTDEKMLREVYCRPRPADLVEKGRAFDLA